MIHRFIKNMRESIAERYASTTPSVLLIVATVLLGTLGYIGTAMVMVPTGKEAEFHFKHEEGMITSLSAIFLASSAAFSLASFVVLVRSKDLKKWAWLVLAAGFAFLSLDEMLLFHERVGNVLERNTGSGVFRNWNDVIVLLYGVVALPIMAILLPGLLRWKWVLEMFAIAFVCYAIHTLIDSVTEPPTYASIVSEESAKLYCGAFLMLGAFCGFLGVIWKNVRHTPSQQM